MNNGLRTSTSILNFAPAYLKAQMEMGAAKKDSKNPYFKSNYADLGAVMEVCKDALNSNGIFVVQPPSIVDGKNCITTRLVHAASGEWMESDSEVICSKANDPQAKGAGETYTRRFSLQAFNFIPSEDDDGNKASGREAPKYTPKAAVDIQDVGLSTTKPQQTTGNIATPVVVTQIEPLRKTSSFSKKNKPGAANAVEPISPAGMATAGVHSAAAMATGTPSPATQESEWG